MNKRRRTAWFSAANIDGDRRQPIGKREGDRWYLDTRIDRSEQLGQEAYEHGIDRGHLTRRDDTAWGDDVKSATAANNDTFHFTNCALQASPFNRGKDRWQGLEQFLLEQHAKKDRRRMTVITGPLFSPNDPVYKNDRMKYSVRCPLQYWKVCVLIRRDDTPAATGFVLGQEDIQKSARLRRSLRRRRGANQNCGPRETHRARFRSLAGVRPFRRGRRARNARSSDRDRRQPVDKSHSERRGHRNLGAAREGVVVNAA